MSESKEHDDHGMVDAIQLASELEIIQEWVQQSASVLLEARRHIMRRLGALELPMPLLFQTPAVSTESVLAYLDTLPEPPKFREALRSMVFHTHVTYVGSSSVPSPPITVSPLAQLDVEHPDITAWFDEHFGPTKTPEMLQLLSTNVYRFVRRRLDVNSWRSSEYMLPLFLSMVLGGKAESAAHLILLERRVFAVRPGDGVKRMQEFVATAVGRFLSDPKIQMRKGDSFQNPHTGELRLYELITAPEPASAEVIDHCIRQILFGILRSCSLHDESLHNLER